MRLSKLIQVQVYNLEHLGMSLFWALPLSRFQWPMAVHFDPPSPPEEGATAIELCRVHSAVLVPHPLLGLGSFPLSRCEWILLRAVRSFCLPIAATAAVVI